ncbi:MAG TPA: SPOR domain-containing protein [Methylophilaceae bacterium]|nr:SPOR domain-containing protein [Methylophilaceae bacterium]
MSRDYKPAPKSSNSNKGSPFLTGVLVGLLLGVGISVGVAVFIKGGDSPFVSKVAPAKKDNSGNTADNNVVAKDEGAAKDAAKPRFDFYTILPGSESQVTEQEIKQKETQAEPAKAKENYFLQVGAFQTEQEADNMKAKLALLGMEAIVQTATIPDKGVWHRVRVGPFAELDQINKARSDLAKNGFNADLIKVNSNVPDQ